jgi:hypothetical protein
MLEKERGRNSLAGEAFHRQLQAAQERKSAIVLKKVTPTAFLVGISNPQTLR